MSTRPVRTQRAFAEVNPGPGGKVNPNFGIAPFGKEAKLRDPGRDGLYAQLNALKTKNPNLKTLLSVGGWSHRSAHGVALHVDGRDSAFACPVHRQRAQVRRDNGFDGIDIDWEYPADPTRGGRPADKKNFTSLMKELREAIASEAGKNQKPALLLTVATPAGNQAELFELGEVAKHVDWINLMTYDFAGSWEQTTGINAPNMKGDLAFRRRSPPTSCPVLARSSCSACRPMGTRSPASRRTSPEPRTRERVPRRAVPVKKARSPISKSPSS
jgi:GH18 family chitinase